MKHGSYISFEEYQYEFRKEWTALRLIGSMFSVYEFWIPIVTFNGDQTKYASCVSIGTP